MTGRFLIMGFGYLLALIVLALFLVECHLGIRKDREIAERDERIAGVTGRNGFLETQNRALLGRLETAPHGPRRRRCQTTPRRRARSAR